MRALAACALAALALPALAHAASGAGVRRLAAEARTSPAALRQLRAIRRVDGRPVDLAAALRAPDRADLDRRLAALAAGAAARPALAPGAEARSILAGSRYHESPVPRPLHGFLSWLGGKLQPLGRLFRRLARHLPFGNWGLATLLGAAIVVLAALAATRAARRRADVSVALAARRRLPAADPGELEREADRAERAGDPDRAVRLRFRAGLLRLGRARLVPLRESLTTAEARRALSSRPFDRLARSHDEIVYGGRAALAQDAVEAREGWSEVLTAKGVRR